MSHLTYKLDAVNIGFNGLNVLQQIDLNIEPGERVAVIGRSGAGKSTLLRYLYELHPQQAAWVPQDPGLVGNLSVYHNVYMGRLNRYPAWRNLVNLFRPFSTDKIAISQLLQELEFADKLLTPTAELSGGQQQRTAVARALYQDKPVVIGDEPISAVDPQHARRIIKRIMQHSQTVILALHDIQIAHECTDRIIGIKAGKIALDAPTTALDLADLNEFYAD